MSTTKLVFTIVLILICVAVWSFVAFELCHYF